jgi:hypothetical protein
MSKRLKGARETERRLGGLEREVVRPRKAATEVWRASADATIRSSRFFELPDTGRSSQYPKGVKRDSGAAWAPPGRCRDPWHWRFGGGAKKAAATWSPGRRRKRPGLSSTRQSASRGPAKSASGRWRLRWRKPERAQGA